MTITRTQKEAIKEYGIADLNHMQRDFLSHHSNNYKVLYSPTGSGKTLAFLLEILEVIQADRKGLQAIIIVPTRELVLQVQEVWKQMRTGYSSAVFYGGHSWEKEMNVWRHAPTLLICTPGRFRDHLAKNLDLGNLPLTVVIDEFDKVLELGFMDDMNEIFSYLTHVNRLMLVSATTLDEMPMFLKDKDFVVVDYLTNSNLQINYYQIHSPDKDKLDSLLQIIRSSRNPQNLIFVSHRQSVDRVVDFLRQAGYEVIDYHGGMEQYLREENMIKFANGTADIMVATDLASRGMDIADIPHVIHYHLPQSIDDFSHRNGRTGRQGRKGSVFFIIGPEETLPEFITEPVKEFRLDTQYPIVSSPWTTIMINAGRDQKIRKADIVGFLMKQGGLGMDDIGDITLQDNAAYATVPKSKVQSLLGTIRGVKIKGKSYIWRRV